MTPGLRLWRWQSLAWVKGGQTPFLLVVLLAEVLFVSPLKGASWAETLPQLPRLMAGAGALAACLILLARWSRGERRDFLRVLPYARGAIARSEALADLGAVMAWGLVWPVLVPPRPEVAALWAGVHLWAGGAGILAARLPRLGGGLGLAALLGAGGPLLALAAGRAADPEGWTDLFWPSSSAFLGGGALLLWIVAFASPLPEHRPASRLSASAWQDPASWLSYRLPLPWRPRSLAVFLLRGNAPLLIATVVTAAYAGYVAFGSLHLRGFRPEPVALLLGVGIGLPIALGLGGAHREFLLTRPISRRRLVAAAGATGLVLVALVPVAGLRGLARTGDEALGRQLDDLIFWELRQPDYLGRTEAGRGPLWDRAQDRLRRETGMPDLVLNAPGMDRAATLAACRAQRERAWKTAGLLALLWLAGGLWVRMRQYAALEGSTPRGGLFEASAVLAAILAVSLCQFAAFDWPALGRPWPLEVLAAAVAGVLGMAWLRLARLEIA